MNISHKVYLDFAATTPLDARVSAKMQPFFEEQFGNPSSVHAWGQKAEAALDDSRELLARWLNCRTGEVVFTSGGTESDNLALRGVALMARKLRGASHILTTPVEHHAVSNTAQQLADWFDFELEYLPVDPDGRVDPQVVSDRIRPDTALVSVIFANNEIGTLNPISDIGQICRDKNVPFHTDAVQAAAHLRLDTRSLNADLISIGAHKFYGPKGVGALYVREGIPLLPIQTGGGQENQRRAGTQNVPYIVGMAAAFDLVQGSLEESTRKILPLRNRIIGEVLEGIPESKLSGHFSERLPNHASFVFRGVDGNTLLMLLDSEGFACSSGSACKTGNPEPSEVLTSLGLSRDWAMGSLRVTLGNQTTPQEIDSFLAVLPDLVKRTKKLSG